MTSALRELASVTNTKPSSWKSIDGPSTGVGAEYWFENKKTGEVFYVCDDQGHITVSAS